MVFLLSLFALGAVTALLVPSETPTTPWDSFVIIPQLALASYIAFKYASWQKKGDRVERDK
jgi:hypothetical protein